MAMASTSPTPDEIFPEFYRTRNARSIVSLDDIGKDQAPGCSDLLAALNLPEVLECEQESGQDSDCSSQVSPQTSPLKHKFLCLFDTDMISIPRVRVFSQKEKKVVARWIRSRTSAPKPLQLLSKIFLDLNDLPRFDDLIVPYKEVSVEEVRTLENLIPTVGIDSINIGSQKVINFFEESTKEQKIRFLESIVDYLITMTRRGACLEKIDSNMAAPVSSDSSDEYSFDHSSNLDTSGIDVDKVLKCIKIITILYKMAYRVTTKAVRAYNKYYTERRQSPFDFQQHCRMESRFMEFQDCVKSFLKPIFNSYYLETYRIVMETAGKKYSTLFKASLYNQYNGQLLDKPISDRLVALDHSYCVSWGSMYLKMYYDEFNKDEKDASVEEECVVCAEHYICETFAVLDICNHFFCSSCIKRIVTTSQGKLPTCPMCRCPFEAWTTLKRYNLIHRRLRDAGAMKGPLKALTHAKEVRRERRGE